MKIQIVASIRTGAFSFIGRTSDYICCVLTLDDDVEINIGDVYSANFSRFDAGDCPVPLIIRNIDSQENVNVLLESFNLRLEQAIGLLISYARMQSAVVAGKERLVSDSPNIREQMMKAIAAFPSQDGD